MLGYRPYATHKNIFNILIKNTIYHNYYMQTSQLKLAKYHKNKFVTWGTKVLIEIKTTVNRNN